MLEVKSENFCFSFYSAQILCSPTPYRNVAYKLILGTPIIPPFYQRIHNNPRASSREKMTKPCKSLYKRAFTHVVFFCYCKTLHDHRGDLYDESRPICSLLHKNHDEAHDKKLSFLLTSSLPTTSKLPEMF